MDDTPSNDAAQANRRPLFQGALNRHGHPFQYAVIRRAHQLADQQRSPWRFEASEFPVDVQGYNTRIDFVLSQSHQGTPYRFLVAECKRANPSLSDWLFARAPYVRRNEGSAAILVERLRNKARALFFASVGRLDHSSNVYHVPLEVKGVGKGDAAGPGRGAIEEAATQVMRGVNGLIECLSKHRRFAPINAAVTFVPVTFTTARIWVTEADLGNTDLVKGHLDLDQVDVLERPWLWLQYHVSPTLKHSVERELEKADEFSGENLGDLLNLEYARSIAVVSGTGIDAFLESSLWT